MRPYLIAVVLAVSGALVAVAMDRAFFREGAQIVEPLASSAAEPDAGPPDAAPSTDPVAPGPARAMVLATLTEAGVSHRSIAHGIFPLRGEGRGLNDQLPLLSFTCPSGQTCAELLAKVAHAATLSGFQLVATREGDQPGRPIYRALSQGSRPALALRAFPSGPRLTVVVSELGQTPGLLDAILALDPHVTLSVLANSPEAPTLARRLIEAKREVLAGLPMEPMPPARLTGDGGLTTALSEAQTKQRLNALLANVPGAVGADTHRGGRLTTSRLHMGAVLSVLHTRSMFFFDHRTSPASLAAPTAQALGVRAAGRTHAIDAFKGPVTEQLKAVEAALVLEGRAVVVVRADLASLVALRRWLVPLRARGIHLLRLSEIVL